MQSTLLIGDYRVCVKISKRELSLDVDCIPTGNIIGGPYLGCGNYTFEDIILVRDETDKKTWQVIDENGDITNVTVTCENSKLHMFIFRMSDFELRHQEWDGSLIDIRDIL